MPDPAYFVKADLSKGFAVSQVAEKHGGRLWGGKHIYTAKKRIL